MPIRLALLILCLTFGLDAQARTFYKAALTIEGSVSSKDYRKPTESIGAIPAVLVYSDDRAICEITNLKTQAVYPCRLVFWHVTVMTGEGSGRIAEDYAHFDLRNSSVLKLLREFGIQDAKLYPDSDKSEGSEYFSLQHERTCKAADPASILYFIKNAGGPFQTCTKGTTQIHTADPGRSYHFQMTLGAFIRH